MAEIADSAPIADPKDDDVEDDDDQEEDDDDEEEEEDDDSQYDERMFWLHHDNRDGTTRYLTLEFEYQKPPAEQENWAFNVPKQKSMPVEWPTENEWVDTGDNVTLGVKISKYMLQNDGTAYPSKLSFLPTVAGTYTFIDQSYKKYTSHVHEASKTHVVRYKSEDPTIIEVRLAKRPY